MQQSLSILVPFGFPLNDASARMGYSGVDWTISRALLSEESRENYIIIQPTSRQSFKCWCEDYMDALINALSAGRCVAVPASGPDG